MDWQSLGHTALTLGGAFLLGGLIGFERQWRQRLAGLRTNTLVALGAAIFVLFAGLFPGEASPTLVAAQIVSGIGFMGAGIIFKEGLNVRGLNTAATLWCSAAIGALPGRVIPSASLMICIEFAVPIPAQTPGPATATRDMHSISATLSSPVPSLPTLSNTSSISTVSPFSAPQAW